MRKLRFDFRDTFGEGSILTPFAAPRGLKTALCTPTHAGGWPGSGHRYERVGKSGTRDLNMEAVVAPEISATVGVVRPLRLTPLLARQCLPPVKCGTAVEQSLHFALSHFGSAGRPQINEVLRQPRKEKAQ